MPRQRDVREYRIEKQLGSAVNMLLRAAEEASAFSNQDLASLLYAQYFDLNAIYGQILRSGARHLHPSVAVRILES